jgi:hypothetical protein
MIEGAVALSTGNSKNDSQDPYQHRGLVFLPIDHFSGAGGASQQPSAPGSAPLRLRVGPVAMVAPSR